jgi:hypothetical protein
MLLCALSLLFSLRYTDPSRVLSFRGGELCALWGSTGRTPALSLHLRSPAEESTTIHWKFFYQRSPNRAAGVCSIPIWPMPLAAAIIGATLLYWPRRRGLCRSCGYQIDALPLSADRCPECGLQLRATRMGPAVMFQARDQRPPRPIPSSVASPRG